MYNLYTYKDILHLILKYQLINILNMLVIWILENRISGIYIYI